MVALMVQASQLPSLPSWVVAGVFFLIAICFAPQSARRPIPRLLICLVIVAVAFSAVGYAFYYVPYDWCSADQSNWYAWIKCQLS